MRPWSRFFTCRGPGKFIWQRRVAQSDGYGGGSVRPGLPDPRVILQEGQAADWLCKAGVPATYALRRFVSIKTKPCWLYLHEHTTEAANVADSTEQAKERRLGVIGTSSVTGTYGTRVNRRFQIMRDHRSRRVSYRERARVISLIVDGSTDAVGALSGRLGAIRGVHVKSALTTVRVRHEH